MKHKRVGLLLAVASFLVAGQMMAGITHPILEKAQARQAKLVREAKEARLKAEKAGQEAKKASRKAEEAGREVARASSQVYSPYTELGVSEGVPAHKILGIKQNASRKEIRLAWKKHMEKYHPLSEFMRGASREKKQQIHGVVDLLTDAKAEMLEAL